MGRKYNKKGTRTKKIKTKIASKKQKKDKKEQKEKIQKTTKKNMKYKIKI